MILEGIIANFDPEKNFWEEYPRMLNYKPFKDFYNRDRSISPYNKHRSSKEMWGFAYLYDMGSANELRNFSEERRKELIARDILNTPNYDWGKEKEVMELMQNLCQPPPQRALYELINKLDQRSVFISTTDYTLDSFSENGKLIKGTADQLDKMMVNTNKIFEQIEFWQKKMREERDSRKRTQQSLTDTGEL